MKRSVEPHKTPMILLTVTEEIRSAAGQLADAVSAPIWERLPGGKPQSVELNYGNIHVRNAAMEAARALDSTCAVAITSEAAEIRERLALLTLRLESIRGILDLLEKKPVERTLWSRAGGFRIRLKTLGTQVLARKNHR